MKRPMKSRNGFHRAIEPIGDEEDDSSPEIRIREMSIDDLAQVFHLGEQVFTSKSFPNLYRTWDEYEVTHGFQMDEGTCLVADQGGEVVGFLLGTIIEKKRSAWKYGHLVWLGVDPRYQRHGVAHRLFDRFRDVTEELGVRILLVDTQADNVGALRFFKKQGFANPIEHVYLTMNLENTP